MLADVALGVFDRVLDRLAAAAERNPWRRREHLFAAVAAAKIHAEGGGKRARVRLARLEAQLEAVNEEVNSLERRANIALEGTRNDA